MLLNLLLNYLALGGLFWSICLPSLVSRRWYVRIFGSTIEGGQAFILVSLLVMAIWPLYLASKVGQFLSLTEKSGQKNQKKP